MIILDLLEVQVSLLSGCRTTPFPLFGRKSACLVVSSKYPNCFTFELKGSSCIIRDATLHRGNSLCLSPDKGVSYPVKALHSTPLGKDFLGFGTALAVYIWSEKPRLTLLKVALPDDIHYRFYAVIDCPN